MDSENRSGSQNNGERQLLSARQIKEWIRRELKSKRRQPETDAGSK